QMADGSVVAMLAGVGAATDQAAAAARCALALRASLPDRVVAVATGRGVIAGRLPVGEVIDRAARMLDPGGAGVIFLDDLTAGLLGTRFRVGGNERGLILAGEREIEGPGESACPSGRLLLGRPVPCVGRDAELERLQARLAYCAVERWARVV